jgi:drug/metabolite transporter (DMT)-like permease
MLLPSALPLLSAVIYVLGALLLKRAVVSGADLWRTTCICNVSTALCFAPLWLLGGHLPADGWWQPALVALIFIAGQTLTLLALRIGDVSIATPVLGLKIVLVALFTTLLLAEHLTAGLWAAAGLSSAAIILLNRAPAAPHARVGATLLLAGLAATAYALFDVLVQKWSPAWGAGRFLPILMAIAGVASLALWPLGKNRPLTTHDPAPPRWPLWLGAACLALQSVTFVSTISIYGHATSANVLYSSRGLWSVLAVWSVGHWFQNREQQLGPRILAWRLCGAAVLLAAILLVLARGR